MCGKGRPKMITYGHRFVRRSDKSQFGDIGQQVTYVTGTAQWSNCSSYFDGFEIVFDPKPAAEVLADGTGSHISFGIEVIPDQ